MKYIESSFLALTLFVISMVLPSAARAEGEHQLTVVAKPTMAGTFNMNAAELVAGETIHLYAYANNSFTFVQWTDESGAVVSKQMDFIYTMPAHDSQLTAEYEYNPSNPQNPVNNYWNKELGEVIIDNFTTGHLQNAVATVINGSDRSEVTMITVAGVMNDNDFGIANNYTNCTLLDLSRVTGITAVPSYGFDYTNLETVYLPATIEKIGYRAFYECKQLSSLIVYAMTPPVLESQVFTNVPEGLIVYVPASSISQYQDAEGWKNFTILPIQEDIRSISISLPEGTNAADYAQMWLELTNTKSGQRMHYVMTDRQTYTFANIIRNTSWNVTLRNERGDIFGQIDNVEVKDEDVSVTFASLSKPQSVALTVMTPDGKNVTSQTQITWMDSSGNYLAQGTLLAGLPVGYQTSYRLALPQDLAMAYMTPQQVDYVLTDGNNNITCQLSPIPQVQISGKVKDASTGLPLSGSTVSASQTFGGKYSKTLNAKTDGNGSFTIEIANVPTSLAFAASDYVSQTRIYSDNELHESNELEDVLLKSISGATISLDFTYTTCDGETEEWYSDYNNVGYTLYNKTKQRSISQYNVQYPQIVLLEDVDDGDVLQLTATSQTNAFMPVDVTATIAEQKASVTFAIVELGKIHSSFTTTGNASVVGSLYDASGKLVKAYNYSNASLTINDLADGQYTLVSMGSSRLFNTIYDLAQLPQTGLSEGIDYVQNIVEVKSGVISQVSIANVPKLNESKLYYTGENTSFTVNKPSIVAGNYLTLTGRIDFKPAYTTSVSNVNLIVDLPESCSFVENSVMVGNSTSSYMLNGNRITIPMARYTDRVRFCIIPTLGGEYAPSAFAQFDLNGEAVMQPIGSANYTVKDLSINVPSTVAKTSVSISGTSIGASTIDIYDNDVLIGQTSSRANGLWTTEVDLYDPGEYSIHDIYAKVTTKGGMGLTTEVEELIYNPKSVVVSSVEMINIAHGPSSLDLLEYRTIFDFINPSTKAQTYWYWPSYPDFTFVVNFTNDEPTLSNVSLNVQTASNKIINVPANYDDNKKKFYATHQFSSNDLPVNVSVNYDYVDYSILDSAAVVSTFLYENKNTRIENIKKENDTLSYKLEYADGRVSEYCYYYKASKSEASKIYDKLSCIDGEPLILSDGRFYYSDTKSALTWEDEDSITVFSIQDAERSISSRRKEVSITHQAGDWDGIYTPRKWRTWDKIPKNVRPIWEMAAQRIPCANPEDVLRINEYLRKLSVTDICSKASLGIAAANYVLSFSSNPVEHLGSIRNSRDAYNLAGKNIAELKPAQKSMIDEIARYRNCSDANNGSGYNNQVANYVMDPSGFVYEGVASNRLKGVTATAYYKDMVEDMYGDLHENIVKWNAEEYAQENPLFTDEYGMYAWDVPQGLWQVKFEKEGYETAFSEWLPVPPPQLDINIAMKQNRQPEVKAARAFEDAVEVEFDKYMMPELLTTENIMVIQNGAVVEGTVELLNEEVSYEGEEETFASKVRFNAAQPFTEQEITLMVSNRVKSYAGIRMQDNYQQSFAIEQEIKQIASDSLITVGYGDTKTCVVSVLPASASKGKVLTVKTSSPMILGVEKEQVTIDNDGKAEITITGELPGTAALTFSVEGTDKEGLTIVSVGVNRTVAIPTTSVASGSVVEKGTAITLSCETEGATIYYTLDGSCPCDNTDARKVYDGTPIIINETVTIKAMATAPNMYESEVVEFTYIVDGTGIDDITVNGQIQIYPLPVRDKVNISADGKTIKNVTVSSINGVVVASAGKPATIITLDVSTMPTGIYIVNIHTEGSMCSRKILKVE